MTDKFLYLSNDGGVLQVASERSLSGFDRVLLAQGLVVA